MTGQSPSNRASTTVVPFFLPNAGCESRCVYCDQSVAAGAAPVDPDKGTIEACIEAAFQRSGSPVEAAFYGGTFTALPLERQRQLLGILGRFRQEGVVCRVRLSTHPAHVDDDRLALLADNRVDVIELGVQSFRDEVLAASGRNVTGSQARDACRRVLAAGFDLVIQLMPFLPGATEEDDVDSAATAAFLKPSAVRIFPTLVLRGTPLAQIFEAGLYRPATLEETTERVAQMLRRLVKASIPVLRIGLQPSQRLAEAVVAGPYHPALGELCRAVWLARAIASELAFGSLRPNLELSVPGELASLILGHGKLGLSHLEKATGQKWRVQVVAGSRGVAPSGSAVACFSDKSAPAIPIGDNLVLRVYTAGVSVEKERT